MKKLILATLCLLLNCQLLSAQAIYGVFSLPPSSHLGEKQIGTINPTSGVINLLGNNTSVEDGQINMTTGATALNAADNTSYFIGEDDTAGVDRIYTVDLLTGITTTAPVLSPGYTTSTNFGIWYDGIDDVLYALFVISDTAELTSIDPSTGVVTTVIADVVGEEVESLASGLMTGGRDNTNGANAKRIFTFINNSLFVINLDDMQSVMIEIGGANFLSNKTFGLEWDNTNNALWFLYNPDLGGRQMAKVLSEDDFTEEAFIETDFALDAGTSITTSSGLSALDEQSGLFFFLGKPSTGVNAGKWSLYTVDLANETSTHADVENATLVQTNGYAGIEVLPGPDMTFTKSDGGVTDKVPGDTITYTLTYSNAANAGSTNGLTLTETVPAETTFYAAGSSANWVCLPDNTAGSVCEINPSEVGPGGSDSVDFAVTVNDMVSVGLSSINNSATLGANNIVNNLMATDSTPITAAPILTAIKTDNDKTDAVPGDTIAYDITASNTGNQVANNVVVTETVPASTTYIPTPPYVWNCVPDNTAGSTCTTTPTQLADTAYDTTFHVQVNGSVPAGTTQINNTVNVSADNANAFATADFTPITSSAVLTLSKTDGGVSVVPGSSVVYQINYGNSGDQDADSAFLTETILEGTQFDSSLSTAGWVCLPDLMENSVCTYTLGTVAGGTNASVDFALKLNSPVKPIYSELSNTATLDASNAAQAMAQDNTPIDAAVNLRIVKTDGEVSAAPDKVINYTLINFNDGNRDAISVSISETVPDNTTFYPPSSTAGWNCTPNNAAGSSCTFDAPELAGDGGKIAVFFAVKVNQTLAPSVTELSNTASISAFNTSQTDEDTELTPIDQIIPTVTWVDTNPSITELASCSQNNEQINEIVVSFQDDNPGLNGIDNLANYALIEAGADHKLQTVGCSAINEDDDIININALTLSGTSTAPIVSLALDDTLSAGQYVLLVCDDITDAAGNAIDGDLNGSAGGNLNRQFRVEFENLFSNAYLDDCYDAPVSMNDWNILAGPNDTVEAVSSPDADDSNVSGSMIFATTDPDEIGVSQCVNFSQAGSHTLSVSVLGLPSQSWDAYMYMNCGFYESPNCTDIIGSDFKSYTLSPSITPEWQTINNVLLPPASTLSAECYVVMTEQTFGGFTFNVDNLSIKYSDLIYMNGFEED